MNSVQLIGRATAAPDIRYAPSGTAVCNMSIAVDDGFGDSKKTFFFGVTLFGKTAETANKYVTKGQRIGITGKLSQDEYTPKNSDKAVKKTHVIGNMLDLLDRPTGDHATGRTNSPPPASNTGSAPAGDIDDDDSIPF